jgi:pimeloyl-ACP methyl ester carboxylesterase
MKRGERFVLKAVAIGLAGLSYLAPPLAGRLATRLWFTPFPFARSKRTTHPTGARPLSFSVEDSVDGYEVGEGPRTALLIHGWAGSSRQYRRMAARLAEEGYRSVVIDLPAHGRDAGRRTHLYEIASVIEAAGRSLGRLDIVAAHSLGAMATAVALQGTLRTDRLVFLAPGLRPHHALDTFSGMLALRPTVKRAIERAMETRFGPDVWERIPRDMLEMPVPGQTLVIHDAEDDMVPIEHSRLLSTHWDRELVSTRGHGHNGVLRATETIDKVVGLATAEADAA